MSRFKTLHYTVFCRYFLACQKVIVLMKEEYLHGFRISCFFVSCVKKGCHLPADEAFFISFIFFIFFYITPKANTTFKYDINILIRQAD